MKTEAPFFLLLCSLTWVTFSCTVPSEIIRPNTLLVSIDDLRHTLGVYDDPVAVTPNLDRLAREGMTFRQEFCQAAICAPSRASLMTRRVFLRA